MTTSEQLWAAVDLLTEPQQRRLARDPSTWLADDPEDERGVCSVPAYRAATTRFAWVPSLWDQSTIALFGGEVVASRGSKPLRERSIADLDLMEIRSTIRETVIDHLELWGETRPDAAAEFGNDQIRHFASQAVVNSAVAARCPVCKQTHGLGWWQATVSLWTRLIEGYLQAGEHQARTVRLRNSACPDCGARQVSLNTKNEVVLLPHPDNIVVPALKIDFREGHVRAAECSMCGSTWFRGPDLERLAADLGLPTMTDNTPSADLAC